LEHKPPKRLEASAQKTANNPGSNPGGRTTPK